jgi:hypothetical protein
LLWALLRVGKRSFHLGGFGLAAAGLFFASVPTVGVWTTGGLSSSLFALTIFLCYEALFAKPDRPAGVRAGLAGVATCLLRADGPFWIVVLLGIALVAFFWRRWLDPKKLESKAPNPQSAPIAFWSGYLKASAILLVVGAIFIAWRLNTYGDYLPNTARAKVGMTALSLERGAKYVLHYWAILPGTVVALLFGLGLLLKRLIARVPNAFDPLAVAALMAAATFCYSIIVGGDFMAMGRFFFPAVAFLALVFGAFIERLVRTSSFAGKSVFALILLTNCSPAIDVYAAPQGLRESLWFRWSSPAYESEFVFWRGMRDRCREWSLLGKALGMHTTQEQSLVRGPIGAVGYYSDLVILDLYGLTNSEVLEASTPATVRSSPGHDRLVDIDYFERFNPTWRSAYLSRPPQKAEGMNSDRALQEVYAQEMADYSVKLKQIASRPRNEVFPLMESDGFPPNVALVLVHW